MQSNRTTITVYFPAATWRYQSVCTTSLGGPSASLHVDSWMTKSTWLCTVTICICRPSCWRHIQHLWWHISGQCCTTEESQNYKCCNYIITELQVCTTFRASYLYNKRQIHLSLQLIFRNCATVKILNFGGSITFATLNLDVFDFKLSNTLK